MVDAFPFSCFVVCHCREKLLFVADHLSTRQRPGMTHPIRKYY
jgi:hypothetical protein